MKNNSTKYLSLLMVVLVVSVLGLLQAYKPLVAHRAAKVEQMKSSFANNQDSFRQQRIAKHKFNRDKDYTLTKMLQEDIRKRSISRTKQSQAFLSMSVLLLAALLFYAFAKQRLFGSSSLKRRDDQLAFKRREDETAIFNQNRVYDEDLEETTVIENFEHLISSQTKQHPLNNEQTPL